MFSILHPPMLFFFLLLLLLFSFLPPSTADDFSRCHADYALIPFMRSDCSAATGAIRLVYDELATYDHSTDDFQPPLLVLPVALKYNTCTIYVKRAPLAPLSENVRLAARPDPRPEAFRLWGDLALWSALLLESCVVPRGEGGIVEAVATIGGMERSIDVEMMSTTYFEIRVDWRNAVNRFNLGRAPR